MTSIIKAQGKDAALLSDIATRTFIESHGSSASTEDIQGYVAEKYNKDAFEKELSDAGNIYHILHYNTQPAGYSKIIFDTPYDNSPAKNITKLERIYLLKEFYDLTLGQELFQFNVNLSKSKHQSGIWLFVWKENHRAVHFYKKNGFVIIGSHDFKISETHSNPNHQLFLSF